MNTQQIIDKLFVGAIITYKSPSGTYKAVANDHIIGPGLIYYLNSIRNLKYKVVNIEVNDIIRQRIDDWIKENK